MNNPYGFIYITTNMINGKKYLGQKKFDCRWKSYLGSGKALKRAIQRYGKENFKRDIIMVCYSAEELNKAERELSISLNVVESKGWYNEVYGGGSMSGYKVSEISKRKNALSHIGKRPSDEVRQKLSKAQKERFSNPLKHPCYGKTITEETRQKMSEAHKGKTAGGKSVCAVGVVRICANGEKNCFGSIREAEKETGVNRSTIQYRLTKNKPDRNGFLWKKSEVAIGG